MFSVCSECFLCFSHGNVCRWCLFMVLIYVFLTSNEAECHSFMYWQVLLSLFCFFRCFNLKWLHQSESFNMQDLPENGKLLIKSKRYRTAVKRRKINTWHTKGLVCFQIQSPEFSQVAQCSLHLCLVNQ
jgi:hypothetical protein